MENPRHHQLGVIVHDDAVTVPVGLLRHADSPRLDGENHDHVRALAETTGALPPILVHRATMRVIDGMHRLRAAILTGRQHIPVRYVDGAEADIFLAAVRANVEHGLPLSLADREAAATRILTTHPQWSDRAIAETTGLASTTVGRIRQRTATTHPAARIGKDGRARPVNAAAARRHAGRLIEEQPHASLRDIAEQAGISPATAKDVRDRLQRGDSPVPAKLTLAETRTPGTHPQTPTVTRLLRRGRIPDPDQILRKLLRDPSLKLTDNGRLLLRWLSTHTVNSHEWERLEDELPTHCVSLVADLAVGLAYEWARLAETLKSRDQREMA